MMQIDKRAVSNWSLNSMKVGVIAIGLCSILLVLPVSAGFDEGLSAAQKGDYLTAVREFQPLAIHGDALAQYNLGVLYENGSGLAQDYKEAVAWYRKAALQGLAHAQFRLGVMYESGRGVPQDMKEAVAWYREAAERQDADAQVTLGVRYKDGLGVARDYTAAVGWYRKAAEQLDARAQHNLGLMYEDGLGVARDYKEAVAWYRKAALQGLGDAQNNLGLMYEKGRGVPQDYKKAVSWFRKAAEQGVVQAQRNLEVMQDHGQGVPSDIELMKRNSALIFAIISIVASPDGRLDKATHDRLWALFPASVRENPKGFTEKLETLRGIAFQKELWESIRLSARAKRVVKTISYSSAKAEALQNDPVGQDKGKRADQMIIAAASAKPYKGILGTQSVSEERANQVLDGLNGTYERLQRLLDPVWREQ